jgi:hypothetical protein
MDESLMKRVIGHAADNIKIGGGPFAAAVVRNGEIISLEVTLFLSIIGDLPSKANYRAMA